MLDIFVKEDKYINAKHIQQKWITHIQVFLLIQCIETAFI